MRTLLLTAAFAASSIAAAHAEDMMASRYGNTTISKGGSSEVRMYYKPDGTFAGKAVGMMGMSMALKGTWKVNGSTLCLTYDAPPPGVTNPLCTPVQPHKVGDIWTAMGRTVTLAPGIQ